MMKSLTVRKCMMYIESLVSCEHFAQVAFLIDTMPSEIRDELQKMKKEAVRKQIKQDARETQAWIQNRNR